MNKDYILGVFKDEESLVAAFDKVKEKGVLPMEVFTPYPVHEILHGMGNKTRITYAAFFYGLFAVIGILAFLTWAATLSWPMNYGGKPVNSFPSFIVVTIVATILSITILTLFTFSLRAKIFPGKVPEIFHERATDDRFVMVIDRKSLGEKSAEINSIISEYGEIE
jgi:NADH:ubiquinone oxidoreductase subunit 5 (subunit L)/multisubunit Na+/H+ antiporter MnhA subunit